MIAAKIILVILTSASAALGNTLLKAGASHGLEGQEFTMRHLPRTFLKPAIIGGVVIYGVSQLLWITVLRVMDLSLAYPVQIGLNFTFIMTVAWLYFKEPVSTGRLAGVMLILAGVIAIATG